MPIQIYVDFPADFDLKVEEVWPDGDAPENPTAHDVIEAMHKAAGSIHQLMSEWSLEPEAVHVRVYNTDTEQESHAQW